MKRTNNLQEMPNDNQKKRRTSPGSNRSSRVSPIPNPLDHTAVDNSDAGKGSSRVRPSIVVSGTEGEDHSLNSNEQEHIREPEEITRDLDLPFQESPEPVKPTQRTRVSARQNLITCILQVTVSVVSDSSVSIPPKELELQLHDPKIYQRIEESAEQHAKDLCAVSNASNGVIFRYGNCTIVRENLGTHRRPLRSDSEWEEVLRCIDNDKTTENHGQLRLYISRDYYQQPPIGDSLAHAKGNEIYSLMKDAWHRKRYITHSDLKEVMSDHAIRQIIMKDECKGMNPVEKESFIQQVQSEGRTLLAICLLDGMKIWWLKHLLDAITGGDKALPFDLEHKCHDECRAKFQRILNGQSSFLATNFWKAGEHKDLHESIVVPLHFFPRDDGKDDINIRKAISSVTKLPDPDSVGTAADKKRAAECGSGAYSNVYCVKLDPNHHSLSKDLDTCFALKELRDRGKISSDHFGRELKILQEIRRCNIAHIVTHLASWTQNGTHYLLFPFAQCNLREYMQQDTFDIRKKEDIIWFLRQVHGIADAVKHIHDLIIQTTPAPSPGLVAPASGDRKTAWHHDLKPENLLLFLDHRTGRGMIRISDWGSGKVSEYRHTSSYHTRSPNGTVTYEPPEAVSDGGVSRPYDLWSLGCVYLELLIWATFGHEEAKRFSSDRETTRGSTQTGSLRDDAFWKLDEKQKENVLRSSVTVRMRRLDEDPSALPFKDFLECVRRMLEINPKKRIKASELSERLRRIYEMKKAGLENDSETQPSLIQTDHDSPDRTSYGHSPLSARHIDPAFADQFNLSPSDMSPHTTRSQHSRNSSASELIPSNPTRSRQSSNASTHSDLSLRNRSGSHSSGNPPRSPGEGP